MCIRNIVQEWARQPASRVKQTQTRAQKIAGKGAQDREEKENHKKKTDFEEFFAQNMTQKDYTWRLRHEAVSSKQDALERMSQRESGQRQTKVSLFYANMQWDWKKLISDARSW